MYQSLQAAYAACSDGDTIELSPQNGEQFLVSKTLDWTNAKGCCVHIDATGAILRAARGFSGPVVIYGAALGTRNSSPLRWDGGFIWGGMVVQNVSYSEIWPQKIYGNGSGPGLVLSVDTVLSYNSFRCIGGIGSCGPCIQLNQLNKDAWANCNTFSKMAFNTNAPSAVIKTTSPAAVIPSWHPGLWVFNNCDLECTKGVLFDSEYFQSATFVDCYLEAPNGWSMGTLPASASIQFVRPGCGVVPAGKVIRSTLDSICDGTA